MSEEVVDKALGMLKECVDEIHVLRRRRDELEEALNHAIAHLEFHGHGDDSIMKDLRRALGKEER